MKIGLVLEGGAMRGIYTAGVLDTMLDEDIHVDGVPYLDGGISDSIPYGKMMEMGYDRIIVVLTRDFSYRKKPSSKLSAELRYHKYPEFRQTLEHRYEAYNASVAHLRWMEKQGKVFVIRPSAPIGIKRIEKDADKLQEVYELGLRDGEHSIHALQEYLHSRCARV